MGSTMSEWKSRTIGCLREVHVMLLLLLQFFDIRVEVVEAPFVACVQSLTGLKGWPAESPCGGTILWPIFFHVSLVLSLPLVQVAIDLECHMCSVAAVLPQQFQQAPVRKSSNLCHWRMLMDALHKHLEVHM